MKYLEPETLDEAIAALASSDDARCLAGGATLVAMLNAELVDPKVLVGLRKIPALRGISRTANGIRIGAMTTHNEIAADDRLVGATELLRSAAGQIAHDAIRHVGTIGGSIAHADPSADWPAAITAADASIEIASAGGARTVSVDDFFLGYLQTAVQPGEIVTAIDIPSGPQHARGHYLKFSRVDGDYATVSIAIVLAMDGKRCEYIRFAAGACGPKPIRVAAAEERLLGTELTAGDIAAAGDLLAAEADPVDDVRGSSEYRRMLIPRLLSRAIAVVGRAHHD
ncbi:MAG TPA: xanthine dehydrogenase family protein subunit M [Steroidobacteraceae bacterium]|nr:xanthine dehydrogenase family protein subunit M [Steroidobacteraceae bacterium]